MYIDENKCVIEIIHSSLFRDWCVYDLGSQCDAYRAKDTWEHHGKSDIEDFVEMEIEGKHSDN